MKRFYQKNERTENNVPPQEQLNIISSEYFKSVDEKYKNIEMEAKFGTRGNKYLTKIDYDNVIKKVSSYGWKTLVPNGEYLLRIQPETYDNKTGKYKIMSNDRLRVEINGLNNIQIYCKSNSIDNVNEKDYYNLSLVKKNPYRISKRKDGEEHKGEEEKEEFDIIQSAYFNDFNFTVSLNVEDKVGKNGKMATEIFEKWNNTKKVFRYLNRVTFVHSKFPFKIDLSIVKSSTKSDKKWMIPVYNIDESNVFNNDETYEIEIEVLKEARTKFVNSTDMCKAFQSVIKQVLSGLQQTNYPVSYVEQKNVLQDYLKLLFEKEPEIYTKKYVNSSDFIGPGLVTLDLINITQINSNTIAPNISEPYAYCVSEKADGERHLLYINSVGRIYLISMNMNVIFTGSKTEENKYFNTLLDGELVLHNKTGEYINTYLAFDIYYVSNVDVRARPFINTYKKDQKMFKEGCRLPILKECVKKLNILSIIPNKDAPIKIISKKFYPYFSDDQETDTSKFDIFEANTYLLQRIADKNFDYEIDGLIFTPTLLGVGGNKMLEAGPKKKITWSYIFKWKPSEATEIFPKSYNTIDFLVVTKKGSDGKDIITPLFENGVNNTENTQFKQYKTLILAVGFDVSKHGYLNPCQDVLDDKFANSKDNYDDEKGYKPKQFFPSDPFDPSAGLCNVMLELDKNNMYNLFTEEKELFDDKMVVEFRYDMSKPGLWKWIPMRVRYDKTAEFRTGNSVGANDYKTANSNWHSIHYPVTEQMIVTGKNIPSIEVSDDVYYNSKTDDKMTQNMRDFHNLYVKKALIQGVSKRGNILIDFACGKAGDLPKWISADLSFVFGIDIAKDNIENRINGACARYLNFKSTTKNMLYGLFVNGSSAQNIRNGKNMFNDKANQITKSVFGSIGVDKSLGPAVERQHGKGANGFDISSCQFAIHYMFENNITFYNFIRNVAECTKLNGYFIATCYDGKTIFNYLKKKNIGESKEIYIDDKKIWSITKQYNITSLENNETCLGHKIDVFQDSINQTLSEYLVNYEFLTTTMDKYGFSLVTREEARYLRLPEGSGMFSELFNAMEIDIKKHPEKKNDYKNAPYMQEYEKNISFLNRYFVFKKTSTRNVEKLTKTLLNQLPDQEDIEQLGTMLARETVEKAKEIIKPKAKKMTEKITLIEATEALEERTKEDNLKEDNLKEENLKEDNTKKETKPTKKTTTRKNIKFAILE
jgi:hypothetical protein